MKPYDTPALLMVAQESFDVDAGTFCKLIPLRFLDGDFPQQQQFLNDGEVWWMLTDATVNLAQPGRILVARLEPSVRFDPNDMAKSGVQAVISSPRDPNKDEAIGIVTLESTEIRNPLDLVESYRIDAQRRPVATVFIRWRDHYYGPFRTISDSATRQSNTTYRLQALDTVKSTAYQFDAATFDRIAEVFRFAVDETVSLNSQPRVRSSQKVRVRHDLLLGLIRQRLAEADPKVISLEPSETKLRRLAAKVLVRRKLQEFKALLDEVGRKGLESNEDRELLEHVASKRQQVQSEIEALDALAKSFVEAGLLDQHRLERIEERVRDGYLAQHGEALRAKLEKSLDDLNQEIAGLKREKEALSTSITLERNRQREALDRELAGERENLAKLRRSLQETQDALKNNLSQVTGELREAGDQVVNRFLSIAPLLGHYLPSQARSAHHPANDAPASRDAVPITRPERHRASIDSPGEPLRERAFIDRLVRIASEASLNFRRIDLERFHLSVKSGDLTVLYGPSGTGKSSLVSIYGQALAGHDAATIPSYLMISVSPSWMDSKDLLGHVSGVDHRFVPSECGLFEFLASAQLEHDALSDRAAVCLACLDEINLAQTEHYFGDFLLALERSGGERSVRCFSANAVSTICPFRPFDRIRLHPGVRFVGTMNQDETTRHLSDRFLDRTNMIYLDSNSLSRRLESLTASGPDDGRPITIADFRSWIRTQPIDQSVAELLDDVRSALVPLGAPVSRRVLNGMNRFIATSTDVLEQERSVDIQIAQRVLPKVRSLTTQRQEAAFNDFERMLTESGFELPESLAAIQRVRAATAESDWDPDD